MLVQLAAAIQRHKLKSAAHQRQDGVQHWWMDLLTRQHSHSRTSVRDTLEFIEGRVHVVKV